MSILKQFNTFYLRQRFFPNVCSLVINPFYFIRNSLLQGLKQYSGELTGQLLDFGCGSKPYKELFTNVSSYVGVDIENEGHDHRTEDIDFYYDGKTLPFKDRMFDSVLASEVLEHVPDLTGILSELNRVLKPGGKLLLTVPFVWTEHELPYDFRRFTTIGMATLLEKQGFKVVKRKSCGNFFQVIVQLWMMYLHNLLYRRNKYLNLIINALFIFPFCFAGLLLSAVLPDVKGLYFNTIILASKQ